MENKVQIQIPEGADRGDMVQLIDEMLALPALNEATVKLLDHEQLVTLREVAESLGLETNIQNRGLYRDYMRIHVLADHRLNPTEGSTGRNGELS